MADQNRIRLDPLDPVRITGATLDDFADDIGFLIHGRQSGQHVLDRFFRDHGHQPDAVVEDPQHLPLFDVTGLLQVVEYGGDLPTVAFKYNAASLWNNSQCVVDDPPARDMGQAANGQSPDQILNRFRIDTGGP